MFVVVIRNCPYFNIGCLGNLTRLNPTLAIRSHTWNNGPRTAVSVIAPFPVERSGCDFSGRRDILVVSVRFGRSDRTCFYVFGYNRKTD